MLACLDCRGSKQLELIKCTAPVAFMDVHNCAALHQVEVDDWSVGGGNGAHRNHVEIGGCSAMSAAAREALQEWATLSET